jgi:DNA-binding NarL/FixJ family response regulator
MSIHVLLSCKHKVISEGIAAVLQTHPDIHLVGVSDDDSQTRNLCDLEQPNVLVVGVDPECTEDVALTRWASQRSPRPEVVAISTSCDRGSVMQMMNAGASSFVSTQSSMGELLRAIRAAGAGRSYLCPSAGEAMVDGLRKGRVASPGSGQLGEREEQVLCLIADGYSSKEIARNLHIAPSTVEVHRRNIMRKVGLHKVADLTRYAIRNQMVRV